MRSYETESKTSPMDIPALMEGVRNLVVDFLAVQPGENALILAEYAVDPVIIQAIAAANAYVGARVHTMYVPPFSPGGCDENNPSPVVFEAYKAADVVYSLAWWAEVHSRDLFFARIASYKARMAEILQVGAVTLATGMRFPPPLYFKIKQKALDRVSQARRMRVTTEQGTDITFERIVWQPIIEPLRPGNWAIIPWGGLNCYPGTSNGVLVIEESTVTGRPEQPVVVRVTDNVVTAIEGGRDAEHVRIFARGGYYIRHAFIGINPKIRFQGAPQFERERHAGTFYLGMDGLGAEGRPDRQYPGHSHCDCLFDTPTVYLDDELFIDRRHLLLFDDPEVREWASAYGNPDRVLAPNIWLW